MDANERAVKAHMDYLKQFARSPHTMRHRKHTLDRLAAALPVPLLEATYEMLYEYRAALTKANNTVAAEMSHIKSFYRWAAEARPPLIEESPAAGVPVPKLPRRFPRPIPEADLMLALSYASSRVRPWLVLAGWCGLRCQEIAWLRVENLRLRDTNPVVIVSTESAKGGNERVVDLSPWVVRELQAARLPLSGYAFTDVNGQPFEPYAVSRIANAHLRGCGISSKFHDLRHRFLTQIQAAGHDILVTQYLAGHATPTSTAGYAAFSRTGATAAVAALPVPEMQEAS